MGTVPTDHVIEFRGKPVLTCYQAFRKAAKRAGLTDVAPQTLRHTTATAAFNRNMPIKQIAKFLGHKSSRTTALIYAKADPQYAPDTGFAVDWHT